MEPIDSLGVLSVGIACICLSIIDTRLHISRPFPFQGGEIQFMILNKWLQLIFGLFMVLLGMVIFVGMAGESGYLGALIGYLVNMILYGGTGICSTIALLQIQDRKLGKLWVKPILQEVEAYAYLFIFLSLPFFVLCFNT